ncbi:MAG TPA: sigma-70 family RNA polymerase sigma factor [Kofleriaceae bacterium]|nr:sigma-70 family RNA polymerase sigma factor [Kofleriaceae bacterium]
MDAAELMKTYKRWLAGFVRRRAPAGAVDDICSKVWEVVAAGVPADLEHPRGWLAAIAFHKIGHALREKSFAALDSALAEKPMWKSSMTSARGKLVRAQQVEQLRRAIASLPPDDRELIHLTFTDGLKPAEIVAATGRKVEPKTLSTQIARIVDRLRDHVTR